MLFQTLMVLPELFAKTPPGTGKRTAMGLTGTAATGSRYTFGAIPRDSKFSVGRYQVLCQTRPI
jgi:hypothetical protein